ncbi:MAG: pyridoxamine 5'-phosphate oxidase family protein [Trueperaceae bacterium]|nr:MAG: pyridoxamine 5'-phosphate oxidase family protein [Trueperaceae bacterium]
MKTFDKTVRNQVVRVPDRGRYDYETIYHIVDEALFCHVGFVSQGQPFVIPTLHARRDDHVLLHGASTSRLMKHLESGEEVCLSMTLVDGIVLARSVFHHSMNYRSVVLFGRGSPIVGEEKLAAAEAFTEKLLPGRWDDARQPNAQELKATSVVSVPIQSASAKIRTGPPKDDDEDYALPVWAGVLPLEQRLGDPRADPALPEGTDLPAYLQTFLTSRNS